MNTPKLPATAQSMARSALTTPVKADTPSLLTTQGRAQKVRKKAHEPREFEKQLREQAKPDEYANAQSKQGSSPIGDAAVPRSVGSSQKVATPPAPSAPMAAQPESTQLDAKGVESAMSQGRQADDGFVDQVIAQIIRGIDQTVPFSLVHAARSSSTVSGQTANAKLNGSLSDGKGVQRGAGHDAAALIDHAPITPQSAEPTSDEATELDGFQAVEPSDVAVTEYKPAHAREQGAQTPPTSPESNGSTSTTRLSTASILQVLEPLPQFEGKPTLTAQPGQGITSTSQHAEKPVPAQPQTSQHAQFHKQVQQGLELAMRDLPAPSGERLVTLRLSPAALGSLRIAMLVKGDMVSVRFQVGSGKAKSALHDSISDLRQAIDRQGLRIESLEIEEESALAALGSPSDHQSGFPEASQLLGKAFASDLPAPFGLEGPDHRDEQGRMPGTLDADHEGGVLQVLTFRLDAVG